MRAVSALALLVAVSAQSTVRDIPWKIEKNLESMQNVVAKPGDVLRFNWDEEMIGPHNVFLLKKCDAEKKHRWYKFKCPKKYTGKEGALLSEQPGFEYTIPDDATGSFCFVCTISGHCKGGQHSTVVIQTPPPPPSPIAINWRTGMTSNVLDAEPGQEIIFKYKYGHNLYKSNTCDGGSFECGAPAKWLQGTGPASWTVPADAPVGEKHCFYCKVGYHCRYKQYLTVTVTAPAEPVIDLERVKVKCKAVKSKGTCKACGGKLKNGACKLKTKKHAKMTCSKIKNDSTFCAEVGCEADGNKCSGTLGLKKEE